MRSGGKDRQATHQATHVLSARRGFALRASLAGRPLRSRRTLLASGTWRPAFTRRPLRAGRTDRPRWSLRTRWAGSALRTSRTNRAGRARLTGWPCRPLGTRTAHAVHDDAGEQGGHEGHDDSPANRVGGHPLLELVHVSPRVTERSIQAQWRAERQALNHPLIFSCVIPIGWGRMPSSHHPDSG